MEKLEKVTFFLEKDPEHGFLEITDEEHKVITDKAKLRVGFFHEWGHEIVTIENENFKNTYAIIEELETGKVYQVDPQNIQFTK